MIDTKVAASIIEHAPKGLRTHPTSRHFRAWMRETLGVDHMPSRREWARAVAYVSTEGES